MPTIEFLGFAPDHRLAAVARVRALVADLAFVEAIVLAVEAGPPRRLITIAGAAAPPFLRIATGRPERAAALEARLAGDFDLELVAIRFCPRTQQEPHAQPAT